MKQHERIKKNLLREAVKAIERMRKGKPTFRYEERLNELRGLSKMLMRN